MRTGAAGSKTFRILLALVVSGVACGAHATGNLQWSHDGKPTPQAVALLHELLAADAYGLHPQDYAAETLTALMSGPRIDGLQDSARWTQFDVELTEATQRFLTHLHEGRVDPRTAGFQLDTVRPKLDYGAILLRLTTATEVHGVIASVEPPFLHYSLLEKALMQYRRLAVPGDSSPSGRMQRRHIRQIELTLERWRWLPPFDTPPIIVNIPQFRLFAFRSTQDRLADILQMDVIVGRTFARTQTPVFAADLKYVIFRPYWDIPRSILMREELPKIRSNPHYLAAQRLEIVRGQTDAAQPLPPTPENIEALAVGQLRLRQQPGADNALGLVKFMLPNSHDVYLHSTPAQQLFRQARRAFSHGCIRVSDPVALAAHVLGDTPGNWTAQKVVAVMNGSATQRVNLAKPIRVMILYGTALATESGSVLFFDDLYGHDRKLEKLLGLAPTD